MRTRAEIEAELAKCQHPHTYPEGFPICSQCGLPLYMHPCTTLECPPHQSPADAITQLETSLKETLHLMDLMDLIGELMRLVPITVGIASRTVTVRRKSNI